MAGTYDILLNPPPNTASSLVDKKRETSLLANQQGSKEENKQASKEANQQHGKPAKKKADKQGNLQASKLLKKFASYLAEDTFYELKALAIQLRRKDYEVLQEAVEEYLKKKKGS